MTDPMDRVIAAARAKRAPGVCGCSAGAELLEHRTDRGVERERLRCKGCGETFRRVWVPD